ncbi:MAG: WD40 repeat domain-containing protein [Treponema sp.]|jgi:WD40 repeat protein|nr:WD40 repeat domain-containing protein [Treponema sp.]
MWCIKNGVKPGGRACLPKKAVRILVLGILLCPGIAALPAGAMDIMHVLENTAKTAVMNKDGDQLAVVTLDGGLSVIGTKTENESPIVIAENGVEAAAYVQSGGREYLVAAFAEHIAIYQANAKPGGRPFKTIGAPGVRSLDGSDKGRFAAGSRTGEINVYNIDGAKSVPFGPHKGAVDIIKLGNNNTVFSAGGGELPRLWNTSTGQIESFLAHGEILKQIHSAIYDEDKDSFFVSAGGSIYQYPAGISGPLVLSGTLIAEFPVPVTALSVFHDGDKTSLLAGSYDKKLHIIDLTEVKDGRRDIREYTGYAGAVIAAVQARGKIFSAAGRNISVQAGTGGSMVKVNFNPPNRYVTVMLDGERTGGGVIHEEKRFYFSAYTKTGEFSGVPEGIISVRVKESDVMVKGGGVKFTVSRDQPLDINLELAVKETARLEAVPGGDAAGVLDISYSQNGFIAALNDNQTIAIWYRDKPPRVIKLPEPGNVIACDNASVAAGVGSEVLVWNNDGSLKCRIQQGRAAAVILLKDDLLALAAGPRIYLYNAVSGEKFPLPAMEHNGDVLSLAFSADGRMLASSAADRSIKLWNVSTGNELELQTPLRFAPASALAYGKGADSYPGGRYIAAGYGDGTILLLDGVNGRPQENTEIHHPDPDGGITRLFYTENVIVTGSENSVVFHDATKTSAKRIISVQNNGFALLRNNKIAVASPLGFIGLYDDGEETGKLILRPDGEWVCVYREKAGGTYLYMASENGESAVYAGDRPLTAEEKISLRGKTLPF